MSQGDPFIWLEAFSCMPSSLYSTSLLITVIPSCLKFWDLCGHFILFFLVFDSLTLRLERTRFKGITVHSVARMLTGCKIAKLIKGRRDTFLNQIKHKMVNERTGEGELNKTEHNTKKERRRDFSFLGEGYCNETWQDRYELLSVWKPKMSFARLIIQDRIRTIWSVFVFVYLDDHGKPHTQYVKVFFLHFSEEDYRLVILLSKGVVGQYVCFFVSYRCIEREKKQKPYEFEFRSQCQRRMDILLFFAL